MDYFPSNVFGLGLHDFYFKSTFNPVDSKFTLTADIHHFMTNQKTATGKNTFGQEIDLKVVYKFVQGTNVPGAVAYFYRAIL